MGEVRSKIPNRHVNHLFVIIRHTKLCLSTGQHLGLYRLFKIITGCTFTTIPLSQRQRTSLNKASKPIFHRQEIRLLPQLHEDDYLLMAASLIPPASKTPLGVTLL